MPDSLEHVDLGKLDLGALEAARPRVQLERVRIAGREAEVAGWIGRALVLMLGLALLAYVPLALLAPNSPPLDGLARAIGTISPLVGVVLGYYFSGRRPSP